jgi:hypothetical protein
MRHRYLVFLCTLAGVLALVTVATVSMPGQNPATPSKPAPTKTAPAKTAAIPRTPWGDPDLQGVWFVMADVPLERSAANAGKEFLTDQEMAASDAKKELNPGRNARAAEGTAADVTGAYNAVFNSILKTGRRTSLIIDPPDGRIPPLVEGAQGRGGRGGGGGRGAGGGRGGAAGAPAGGAAAGGGRGGGGAGRGANASDNPETVGQEAGGSGMVRCFGVTLPFIASNSAFAQGTVMQIVQGQKSMGIYMEDDHSGGGNRTIFMDGRPHLPASVKLYLGDSRGHWEGNTLVVETTNFQQGYNGANPDTYKMTERYTRVDANNLKREVTFDDPKTWTRPWTILIEMGKTDDARQMIFDSACHEGNYGMVGILVGARREEQAAKK